MLSISKVKNSSKSTHYFEKDDYYAKDDPNHQNFSMWHGKGADELGLTGIIKSEDYQNVLLGELSNGQSIGMIKDGKKVHDPARDLTFSAPKSVSIMALVYDDKKLIEAHNEAVRRTLSIIEKEYLGTRVKVDGRIEIERSGKMVAAMYRHSLSRELDPQLHTHCIVANLTRIDNSDKWRTAYFDDIYDNKILLGQIYRSELANLVKELGYEIEIKKDGLCYFEIKSVPKELLELFSTRSRKIKEIANENASQKQLEKLALISRKNKGLKENDPHNKLIWQERAEVHLGRKFSYEVNNLNKTEDIKLHTKQAIEYAISHLSERKTVFETKELISIALNDKLSICSYNDISKGIEIFINEKKLLLANNGNKNLKNILTTPDLLKKENDIVELLKEGKDKHSPITTAIQKYTNSLLSLNDGQQQSVKLILNSKDRIIGVQGYAGVGKTTMLKTVNEIANLEGYHILGLSPTGVATRNLSQERIKSSTLQRFLMKYDGVAKGRGTKEGRIKMQQDFKNTIVVVDESSMIGTSQMKNLLTISKELNFRLVLVGDTKQLDSVEAGTPFQVLQRNGMPITLMGEIVRQNPNPKLKSAIYDTINSNIHQAFEKIEKANSCEIIDISKDIEKTENIHLIKDKIIEKTVSKFIETSEDNRKSTMILTPANETREEINNKISELIHKERINNNSINKQVKQKILQNKNLTEAEKTRAYRFKEGDVLLFSKDRDFLKIEKGNYCKVVKVNSKANEITIELPQKPNFLNRLFKLIPHVEKIIEAKTITFNPLRLKGKAEQIYFEIFEEKERIFRIGDKISFNRTIPEINIINSDLAEIKNIKNDKLYLNIYGKNKVRNISLKLDDVKSKHIDHSYATTAHKAQGLTCDSVIAVCESYRKNLTTQKNFYVEVSRARQQVIIVTDNKEKTISELEKNTGIEVSAREHQGRDWSKNGEHHKLIHKTSINKPKNQLIKNEKKQTRIKKDNKVKTQYRKDYLSSLSQDEVKEHFIETIKSKTTIDNKDLLQAIDKSFSKVGTKIRFGKKLESEICWYGEVGYIKNYRTDEILKWGLNSINIDDKNINIQNLNRNKQQVLSIKESEQERLKQEKEAAEKANNLFKIYKNLTLLDYNSNKYLKKKSINSNYINNIKITKDGNLVIPLYDENSKIHTLQYINEQGEKRFLKGGKKQGNFFLIDNNSEIKSIKDVKSKEIYFTEGFATGVTINIATNKPVIVCFDAGNISSVLKTAREIHPSKEFIIAADNDLWKDHNTGKEKAQEAANLYKAKVILPKFNYEHKDHMPTDFNDLHKLSGIDEIKKQLQHPIQNELHHQYSHQHSHGI